MTPVRIAAVGVGGWARVLADATRQGTGLAIVACTSRSADNRAAFAKAHGCRALLCFEAILADPDVEGVLITTPHSLHAEQVVAAARAGKHVFVDKPFALTVADAQRATQACHRTRVVLAVGHQRRRQPASRALKRLLDEGAMGRTAQIEGNFSGSLGYLGTSWVHANRTAVITVHGTEAQAWSEADGTRLFLARRAVRVDGAGQEAPRP